MYHNRPKKESNECQTDLQCTPFILSENETAKVQSSRLCQTEIQLSPQAPDTELYKIIPYVDEDEIQKNSIRSVNIPRNRKIKLQFFLPLTQSECQAENNDYKYIITDGLDEEVKYVTDNENLEHFSNESFFKVETRKTTVENIDSLSSVGTLKSAIKKILKEDESTQTDLMIAPHILNDSEKAVITINTSCQTSVTCSPRTSITNVVPMLKSYWEHQGETREAFNKTENVLEILKEVIQDVINIHQHMFDPNYNLPIMNPVLVKIGCKNSSMDSSEWDPLSPSKTAKTPVIDVSGDGSFDNTTSELNSTYKICKPKIEDDKQSTIVPSISTISEVTTLRSSDFTLASTKDDDYDNSDDDVIIDDDIDDVSGILERLKMKYTAINQEDDEKISNVKSTQSEPVVLRKMETVMTTETYLDEESITESFGSEFWSDNGSKRSLPKDSPKKCEMLDDSCVCSGIKIKLYLKDKSDNNNNDNNSDRFIEMKIKPNLDNIEIKKILNVSTDPELSEICTAIPFQDIENCFRDKTIDADSTEEELVKLFEMVNQPEPIDVDISKADGFQIMINTQKTAAFSPETASDEFIKTFMLTNLLLEDVKNAPYPEMLGKVSFPKRSFDADKKDNINKPLCSCSCADEEKNAETPKNQNMISESSSPFTTVFGRLHEEPDNLIPFDSEELFCVCKHDENESVLCDVEYDKLPENNIVKDVRSIQNASNQELNTRKIFNPKLPLTLSHFSQDNELLSNMSSDVILPQKSVIASNSCSESNSVSYAGHIYQTDKFIVSGGSDGSEDSVNVNGSKGVHDAIKKHNPRNISYEEQMYITPASNMRHQSNTSLTDDDCICAQKLEMTLKECPHCFKRIGPQYGREQRGLNDEHEEEYEPRVQTDYCSQKQGSSETTKKGFFIPSIENYTFFPTKDSAKNIKASVSANSEYHVAKIVDVSRSTFKGKCNSQTNIRNNENASYILIEKSVSEKALKDTKSIPENTAERNIKDASKDCNGNELRTDPPKQIEIIEKVYSTGKIVIGKINSDNSEETKQKTIESCNICYENDPCPKALCKDKDIVKHPQNQGCKKLIVEKPSEINENMYPTEKIVKVKIDPAISEEAKYKAAESHNNGYEDEPYPNVLCQDKDIVRHPLNQGCSKLLVEKTSEISGKMYSMGRNVVGKINSDFPKEAKHKTAGSCNTCYEDELCPKILCQDKDIVKHPLNHGCCGLVDEKTSRLNNNFTYKEENNKTTPKNKCQTCSKAKLNKPPNKIFKMRLMEDKLSTNNIIPNKEVKDEAISKSKCKTCSQAKLSNLALVSLENTSLLNTTLANKNEKYEASPKTKCKKCCRAKPHQTNKNNLSMVTIQGICSICSSTDEFFEIMKYNAKSYKSYTCTAICYKGSDKSGIKLEAKRSVDNLQKLTQEAKQVHTSKNKCNSVTKKYLSCSNLLNKDSHISSNLIQSDKYPKTKHATCKRSLNFSSTLQQIYPPQSKSLNCTCIKSRCRLAENMEKPICLEKKSIKNKCSTCTVSKEKPVQSKHSHILEQVKDKLEKYPERRCKKKTVDDLHYPAPPYNSVESNCKCSKCIFSKHLNEDNKCSSHTSKCLNLPSSSVQKIFEKNLPCSCSSSSTNQKDENSDINLGHLAEDNPDVEKYKQNKETSSSASEISDSNIQDRYKLPERVMFASDFDSKNIFPTETTTYRMEVEKLSRKDIQDEDLLSTLSITTRPKVRISNIPKYIYKSYSSVFDGQFVNESVDSKEVFYQNSLDTYNDKNSVKKIESSEEEYALANISKSDDLEDFSIGTMESSLSSTKTALSKPKIPKKIMNIHKLDGKYSVFSMERIKSTVDSETTVYILPNAAFSSLLSVPAPYFLRERTESEIDDIIQFSHLRNIHYIRNPEFDQNTKAESISEHNSEEIANIITEKHSPSMNCAITCSCSSSAPKNQEQRTDNEFACIKADKTTSIASLEESKNIYISPHNHSVGIQSSYEQFYSRPSFEEKTFSSSKENKYCDDTIKSLENTSRKLENNMQIMGKYITWKDLINPNLCKPIPIQSAITSMKPFIDDVSEKIDMSLQTSNTSYIAPLLDSSIVPPLTIEASTSTRNLDTEMSINTSFRYHLSENLSTIDLPVQYPTTSDSNLSVTNKILQKHLFENYSAKNFLKKTNSPTLTLEASTSTNKNQVIVQEQETLTSELLDNPICLANISSPSDKNLIKEEATETFKYEAYEEFVKASTSKLPTNKTTSSISLTRITSLYKYTSSRTQSLIKIEEASTSKEQTNIEVSSKTSTKIASHCMNSTLEALPQLEEPILPNLESAKSYSHISLQSDQISCFSLPKVESLYSISESNYYPTDTETNFNNNDSKYTEETEKSQYSMKILPELSVHSKEDVSIPGDISVPRKKSSVLLMPELVKENNERLENKTISTQKNYLEDVIDTNLLPVISATKWNTSKPQTYSGSSNVYSGSSRTYEDHIFDKYNNLGHHPFITTSEDQQTDARSIDEHINKNVQLENLLSRAVEAYTAYLTLKKGISSNFNVSKIELPYEESSTNLNTSTHYSKYAKKNGNKFSSIDTSTQHSSKDYYTDSVISKSDYYNAYLKRKEKISSLISNAKMDSSYIYSHYMKENDENSLKLPETNNNKHSPRGFETNEDTYPELLQENIELPTIESVTSIHPSPNDLKTEKHPSNNLLNQQSYSRESNFTSKKREEDVVLPLPPSVKNDSSRTTSSKPNTYRDLKSEKFILKNDEHNSVPSKGKTKKDLLNRNLFGSADETIKTEKDIYKIENEYIETLKRKEELDPKHFESSPGISKEEKISPLSSITEENKPYKFTASEVSYSKEELTIKKSVLNSHPSPGYILNHLKTETSLSQNSFNISPYSGESSFTKKNTEENSVLPVPPTLKNDSTRTTSSKPKINRDLKTANFILKKDEYNSVPSTGKERISQLKRNFYISADETMKTEKDIYNIESDNKPYNSTTSGVSSPKNINMKFDPKNEGDHSITRKDKNETSLKRSNSPSQYSKSPKSNIPADLRSDKFIFNTEDSYSAYLEGKEIISGNTQKMASSYIQNITRNRNPKDLHGYSTSPKDEGTISPKSNTPPSLYPITENVNLKSRKFIHNPENRESKVSSPRNLETEINMLNPSRNYNLASSKNSATSKLSAFVRNGVTSALLSNVGDSPQQLSAETIDNLLPDISSSHRVLEAVQSCEQRLKPIKSALQDIKMKLKELNMPEVNSVLQNEYLEDEINKTFIYLPPPPPPLISSRCSYRTKMTFQLKKPINPLSVTANVNPFSIKHKYILNDADNDQSMLNTNYSSVSDPPYFKQRTSINSINPILNQPSRSDNKPLHSKRYPDNYVERPHKIRKPVEVIQEDLPFSPEDRTMDEFQQLQYLPDNYEMFHYQPRTESLNNYVVFPSKQKNSKVYVPVTNSMYKPEHYNYMNNIQNRKMFTGDYPVWKKKPNK